MSLLTELDLDHLHPAKVWSAVPVETRVEATQALFTRAMTDEPELLHRTELLLAQKLKFREAAVRKLSLEKKVSYFSRLIKPDDSLAASLLLQLHLDRRRPLLKAFLDALGIANDDGTIAAEELEPPKKKDLEKAVAVIDGAFPPAEVELYLVSLLAMDSATWGGLAGIVAKRK